MKGSMTLENKNSDPNNPVVNITHVIFQKTLSYPILIIKDFLCVNIMECSILDDTDQPFSEGSTIKIIDSKPLSLLSIVSSSVSINSLDSFIDVEQTTNGGLISIQSSILSFANPLRTKSVFNIKHHNFSDSGSLFFSFGPLIEAISCPTLCFLNSKWQTLTKTAMSMQNTNIILQSCFCFQLNTEEGAVFLSLLDNSTGSITSTYLNILNDKGFVFETDSSSSVTEGINSYTGTTTNCKGNHNAPYPTYGSWT